MSDIPGNDIERDARLADLYRAAAREDPPAALDDAIRAAARRGVSARPRLAGSPFSPSWRLPLSIAAVILICVSLVTLMREEAPDIARPPNAASPAAETESKPTASTPLAGEGASNVPKATLTPAAPRTNARLKPPQRKAQPDAEAVPRVPGPLAKQVSPEAFPGATGTGDNKLADPSDQAARKPAQEQARSDYAASAEVQQRLEPAKSARPDEATAGATPKAERRSRSEAASADDAGREAARGRRMQAAPAPATPPTQPSSGTLQAYVNLPPEKWLEQIEVLRKQRRVDDAKKSFAEFRKRYPDYPLPDSLKEWDKP